MTIRNRMLALRQAVQSHLAGTQVLAFERREPEPVDIDDCDEVMYAPDLLDLFPDMNTPCDSSPHGQCTFDALSGDEHDVCIYCGRRTG